MTTWIPGNEPLWSQQDSCLVIHTSSLKPMIFPEFSLLRNNMYICVSELVPGKGGRGVYPLVKLRGCRSKCVAIFSHKLLHPYTGGMCLNQNKYIIKEIDPILPYISLLKYNASHYCHYYFKSLLFHYEI